MDSFQIIADKRETNWFDNEKATKNQEKTKVYFTYGTKARSKGFDPKINKVLTLLIKIVGEEISRSWNMRMG